MRAGSTSGSARDLRVAETLSETAKLVVAARRREREAKRRAELKAKRVQQEKAERALARLRNERAAQRRAELKEQRAQLKRDQLVRALLRRALKGALAGESRVEVAPSELAEVQLIRSSIGLAIKEEPLFAKEQRKIIEKLGAALKALRAATSRAAVVFADRRLTFARHVSERTPLKLLRELGRLEGEISSLAKATRASYDARRGKYAREIAQLDDALRPLANMRNLAEKLKGYLRVRELFRKKYLEGLSLLQAEAEVQRVFVHDASTNTIAFLPDTYVSKHQGGEAAAHAAMVAKRKELARSLLAELGIDLYGDEVDNFLKIVRSVERTEVPGDEHEIIAQQRELWSKREEWSAKIERLESAARSFELAYSNAAGTVSTVKSRVLGELQIRPRDVVDLDATKWWAYLHSTPATNRLPAANRDWVALIVWLASTEATRLLASIRRALLAAAEEGKRSARFLVEGHKEGAKFSMASGRRLGASPCPPKFAVEVFRALDVETESRVLASGAIGVTCRWAKRSRSL